MAVDPLTLLLPYIGFGGMHVEYAEWNVVLEKVSHTHNLVECFSKKKKAWSTNSFTGDF